MISCKELTELSSQYLDREMPLMQRMQMKLHLMMCKNCRGFMQQLEKTMIVLGHMQPEQMEEQQVNQQVDRLLEELHKAK